MAENAGPLDLVQMEIGRVAQNHVHLDFALRQVFVSLASPSPAVYLVNDRFSTDSLMQACKTMLRRAAMPSEVDHAGTLALQAAKAANMERNRVVHDMWLPDYVIPGAGPPRWNLSKIARGTLGHNSDGIHDLESLEAVRLQLARAHLRVFALQWALYGTLPYYRDLAMGMDAAMLGHWIAVMEDHFVLNEDGSFQVDGCA